mmetsp:Transcript_105173/g.334846  ORF Transcript_105173/g.334846 Transcript_105173/m.334846 type:complete len:328 (+) Transcript_105173:3-986(+)
MSARSRSSDLAADLQRRGSSASSSAPAEKACSKPGPRHAGRPQQQRPAAAGFGAARAARGQETVGGSAASSSGAPCPPGRDLPDRRISGEGSAAEDAHKAAPSSWGARTAAALQREPPPGRLGPSAREDDSGAAASTAASEGPQPAAPSSGKGSPLPAVIGREQKDESAAGVRDDGAPDRGRRARSTQRASAPVEAAPSLPGLHAGGDLLGQIELPVPSAPGDCAGAPAAPVSTWRSKGGEREAKFAALDEALTEEAEAEVRRAISHIMDSSAFRSPEGLPGRTKAVGRGKPRKKNRVSKLAEEAGPMAPGPPSEKVKRPKTRSGGS